MTAGEIRGKLSDGIPSIGTWLQLPSPDVAEIMADCGYDWVCVDMEHGSFGADSLPGMFRAIQCGGSAPFARLPAAEKVWIKAALEAGATGLIFPMIESARQLEQAIDLATYPGHDPWRAQGAPGESRGVGFCRANAFGKRFDDYLAASDSNIFLAAQIEHINAVRDIDAILAHSRLDAIMVGPYDLSGSMGLTGRFDAPEFQSALNAIATACRQRGIPMGCHVVTPDPDALRREIRRGSLFIAYGIDALFLWQTAQKPDLGQQGA